MKRLCLDYGHGGRDPGACYRGRREKDDVLDLGRLVARDLRRQGLLVDETRTTDRTMSLKARSDFERRGRYDFFISFHRNAFKAEKASGVETFIYLGENKEAKNLALSIQKNLKELGFKDRGVKKANFHVLRETRSPALLIELGFIDNSRDNKIFVDRKDDIVRAIARAILDLEP